MKYLILDLTNKLEICLVTNITIKNDFSKKICYREKKSLCEIDGQVNFFFIYKFSVFFFGINGCLNKISGLKVLANWIEISIN